MNGKQVKKFMERVAHIEMLTGAKAEVDLNELRGKYGNDFNTLSIINTDADDNIEVYLGGVKVKLVTANNGVFSFDWELGLNFNFLTLENVGAGTIAANAVKITVGRTGRV